MTTRITYTLWIALILVLAACSPTQRLAEGEVLYTGIKEISYGQKAKAAQNAVRTDTTQTGVITDVAHAVEGISSLIEGKSMGSDPVQQAEAKVFNDALDEARAEVEGVLAYAPTGSVFGSSSMSIGTSPGVMFYNLFADSKRKAGRWMFSTFAKEPVTLTAVNPKTRALVATNTLRNYGFLDGSVEYDIINDKKPKRAHLTYSVYPRRLYRLDSIEYRGFPTVMDSLLRRTMPKSELKRGNAFTVPSLDAERIRIATLMRDRGYYNFSADAISYRADTIMRPGYVQLRVQPAATLDSTVLRRYYIGSTEITLLSHDDYQIVDSIPRVGTTRPALSENKLAKLKARFAKSRLQRLSLKMRYSGKPGRPPLRLAAMRKQLSYRQGMPYNDMLMDKVRQQLSAMGVFSTLNMQFVPKDDTLGVRIIAVLDKPYDSEFEARFTSKSNGQIGPGASYALSKRNALRRAEVIKWKVRGSYEWQTGAHPAGLSTSAINSYELGTSLQMDFPRMVLPGTRFLNMNSLATTTFKVDGSWLNRAGYFSMVEMSGEATYTLQRHRQSRHIMTPIKLKYASLLTTTDKFDEVANRNQALYASMRDQLVPSMEYTCQLMTVRSARHPAALTVTLKESGNIVSGIYAAAGRPFREKDKTLLGVPFAQYLRMNIDMRKEIRFTPRQSLVPHISMGAIFCYGNTKTAPYSDLFCVGGANSIRAFCLRSVGPGRYNPARSGYSYLDQMGDIKFEANLEYRFPVVASLYGAVFFDCGNVWLMNDDTDRPGSKLDLRHFARDLAVGTGAGLRYDLDFLVVRFDVGVGLHAPYDTGRSGYYNMPRFGRSLGYHFAIGYPF